ncbi:MAG: glycosyltransferase family 1 protein [Slackia sp.]|nr:glycosyltransferase family 1 protein [Slackia sp.]
MNDNPVRILHVIGAMNRGGAETIVMNLYRCIDRTKIQFDFLVGTDEECDYDREIRELGGCIYSLPRFTGTNYRAYKKACRDFFRSHRYPIVHGHIGSSAAIYLSEAKKAGAFAIAHSHAQHFPLSPGEIAFRMLSFPTRFIADYFIACSQQAGLDRYGRKIAESARYHILKNGIDSASYRFDEQTRKRIRDELSIPNDALVYGHVGRFDPIKNHVFLIDVFEATLEKKPDAFLVLAGREDAARSIRKRCENDGIQDKVRFLGLREDICHVLSAMDVFIFPSFKEGLPMATIEAQASGLPCLISTGVPSLAQVGDRTDFLPLSAGARAWSDAAIEKFEDGRSVDRANAVDDIRNAGFDIDASTAWLQDFYLDIAEKGRIS